MDSRIGDIRDAAHLSAVVTETQPEVVLHLAAQPLVRRSYAEPAYTFEVNVMGTTNVLEAARACDATRVVVNVTTDKVYANPETGEPFSEEQPLGGHDPYSASKAASEIVTASYRASFFSAPGSCGDCERTGRQRRSAGATGRRTGSFRTACGRFRSARQSSCATHRRCAPGSTCLEPLSGYLHLAASALE